MSLKRKSLVVVALLSSSLFIAPLANAASTPKPKPFTVVKKEAGLDLAKSGCTSVGVALQINDAFLKLPVAQQTASKQASIMVQENAAMLKALQTFKAAVKANKKWQSLSTYLNAFLDANDADTFTKAFGGLLKACTAINPAQKK